MKELTISIELANAILGYLGTKPFQEVHQLVVALQDAAKQQPVEAELIKEGD